MVFFSISTPHKKTEQFLWDFQWNLTLRTSGEKKTTLYLLTSFLNDAFSNNAQASILDIHQSTFCGGCRYGIPWLAFAVNITEVPVLSTPAHLLFIESFLPKLFLLFFQIPDPLELRLVDPHLLLQVLYWLVFALLQHYQRVILSLHCAMWRRALNWVDGMTSEEWCFWM